MPRLEPVSDDQAGLFARLVFWISRRMFGRVLSSTRVVAHHQMVLAGMSGMEGALQRCHSVPERLKALAGIKAAMMVGCPF